MLNLRYSSKSSSKIEALTIKLRPCFKICFSTLLLSRCYMSLLFLTIVEELRA